MSEAEKRIREALSVASIEPRDERFEVDTDDLTALLADHAEREAALRAEVEALKSDNDSYREAANGYLAEVEALRAALAMQPDEPTEESIRWAKDALDRQIEEWQRDAGRYRFMKENLAELLTLCAIAGTNTDDAPGILAGINASRLDAAIDAALAQAKENNDAAR